MTARMHECSRSMEASKQYHRSMQCKLQYQAADHSSSAIEVQASGSYPAAAADHSNSTMEAQARGSYSAAADHSNSAMEAQASSSYPAAATAGATATAAAAAAGKQQIIATVLWKRRLVAAIQQLYKLLYKSCIEAKQNIVAGRDCNCSARSGSPVEQLSLSELKHAFAR